MYAQQQRRQRRQHQTINPCWSQWTEGYLHGGIRRLVVGLGTGAATYPWTTVICTGVMSMVLLVVGFFSHFELELNQLHFVTPTDSYPDLHHQWIQHQPSSGFPKVRIFYLNIHQQGNNALTYQAMEVALEAMKVLQSTTHYHSLCHTCQECSNEEKTMLFDGTSYCRIGSVTQFWDHSLDKFQNAATSSNKDEYIRQVVSQPTYPDGTPVYHEAILGNYKGINTTSGESMDYTNAPPLSLATLLDIYTSSNQNNNNTSSSSSSSSSWDSMYLTSAQCLIIKVDIPDLGSITDELEQDALEQLAVLQDKYLASADNNNNSKNNDNAVVQLEYFTMNGYQYEMMRALYMDMPLVGVLVVVMVAFAVGVFSDRHNRVQSRGMIGLWSFTTIGLSLWTGYGIMWCLGVPLTTVAILIPFIVSGVGLDDSYIITGTYFRLLREEQHQQQQRGLVQSNENDRITTSNDTTTTISHQTQIQTQTKQATTLRIVQDTLDEVAVSITMTTITTLLAFITGGTSRIPAVRWLCWYAAISLFVVYVYQITCFIAFLVLDEQRVQANRKDLCIWIVVNNDNDDQDDDDNGDDNVEDDEEEDKDGAENELENEKGLHPQDNNNGSSATTPPEAKEVEQEQSSEPLPPTTTKTKATNNSSKKSVVSSKEHDLPEKSFPERLMGWYADQLLKPISKMIVLVAFVAYFAGTVYSTTLLRQEFNIEDYIPEGSFMATSMRAYEEYSTYLMYIEVYFRNVDQSDPEVQLQMRNYVQELSELDQVGDEPGFFWLRDFQQFTESNQTKELIGIDLDSLSFNEQVDLALSIPQLRQIYGRDIVRDPESGNITASRCQMFLREFDMYHVPEQIDLLLDQREISLRQPVNDKSKRTRGEGLNFFTFAELYFYWELFATAIDELILNTVLCVVVVSVTAFVMVPHWSAVFYACPLLIMLYFNLMGTMQYCGITINVISYFILVTSIGLLVDFLMHILLRYYESKRATRNEKVKETLETIGASILMGAFTTFLGVIPMAFSTTKIFNMVFICFLAMVILGCAAGLILLPVLLSLTGPVGNVRDISTDSEGDEYNEIAGLKHEKETVPNSTDSEGVEDSEKAGLKHDKETGPVEDIQKSSSDSEGEEDNESAGVQHNVTHSGGDEIPVRDVKHNRYDSEDDDEPVRDVQYQYNISDKGDDEPVKDAKHDTIGGEGDDNIGRVHSRSDVGKYGKENKPITTAREATLASSSEQKGEEREEEVSPIITQQCGIAVPSPPQFATADAAPESAPLKLTSEGASPPIQTTQQNETIICTFTNSGSDPTKAQAELYYENTWWGPLGHKDDPITVQTYPGHRWFIVANGIYVKLFTVGQQKGEEQQSFTF